MTPALLAGIVEYIEIRMTMGDAKKDRQTPVRFQMGADLLRRKKADQFREVGFGRAIRIDRERLASAA